MADLQEYKCPCCGGAVTFDSTVQKMKCPYCDTEFEMETLAEYNDALQAQQPDEMHWEAAAGSEWQEGEAEGIRSYICKSCGGEIAADENTAAAACPFCGNPVVMTGRLSGVLKPDYVIPFKLDKKAAKEALTRYYSGKKLLPKAFKDQNHVDEVKGVYVPFWLFDAEADVDLRFRASRVRTWSDSRYHYTETSFYSVIRGGSISFAHVPVDGSTKMADDLMESIEPFDFSQAVDFQTAYLAGYLADKYDVDAVQSEERANERIRQSAKNAFASTVHGYTTVVPEAAGIRLHGGRAKYALYPVWLLNTTWNGQKYMFAMNGQTGKMVGDLPLDHGAYARWLLGLTGLVSAVVFAASWLFWML